MEYREQEFVFQLPHGRSYGPYVCSEGVDIARHLLRLSETSNPQINGTPFRVKLPKSLAEYILVIAYPSSPCPFDEPDSIVVYGVECKPGETLTEDEIRNRLRTSYATYDDGGRCLCVYKQSEANELTSTPKYARGTIFVASDYDSCSPYSRSPPSGCPMALYPHVDPPTDLPLHSMTNKSHVPITATSDTDKVASYVVPNQNLVLANSPSNDDMRKVLAQMDDAPTQALMPDRPHLEQKPLLQNLGDLAGGTALQSVLVTPSTEQPDLAGPLPCSGNDKSPKIVVHSPSEEREAEEREKIVQPQTESSKSVSASPKSTSTNQENFLGPYRRQRSLSGDDMVAPELPKSHKGMVTGRTLSLPPSINDQLNEKLRKSTEDLCAGSSSSMQRTQSDLSTLVHRKSSLKLLLDCGTARSASDNCADDRSSECERTEPKMRRRSMSDLGVQRQDSGGDLNEAVIAGVGVAKSLLTQNTSANCSRQRLASTIHEQEREEESEMKSLTQPQAAPQTETSVCVESGEKLADEESAPKRPSLFRLGSLNETSSQEDDKVKPEEREQYDSRKQPASARAILEQEVETNEDDVYLEESNLKNSWSALPQREVRQQVHIMEHVYNGKCVLGDECPRPPSAECLKQMSGLVETHRGGVLSPLLTEWLKNLIRVHCCRCRDSTCSVPHLAAGCAQPGSAQSYGSSSGSAIASTTGQPPLWKTGHISHDQEDPVHEYQQISSISVDKECNMSNSDQVREWAIQCAEIAFPPGHRGTNFTDNPPTPQTGCFAPATNGTSPNYVNPMYPPQNYHHPRPSMLPGVHQGLAPIPATTNDTGRRNLSPYPSTGFLPPMRLYGQPVNTVHSPIQQASDADCNGVLNRDQVCYIQPNQRRSNFYQDHHHSQLSPSELPNVLVEGFPHSSKYSSTDAGVLIYCSERLTADTGFLLGALGRPPNPQKADVLGSGGNGSVFGYFQNGKKFAVKKTTYRQTELQAWLKLNHPNVLPLLGVMWGGHCCYQFMPKMTGDLSSVMRSVGDLCTLVRSESRVQWENVLRPNVCHVVMSLVSGVKYLHNMGIQHYDLKASNILIYKPDSCQCADIFCCECPLGRKCEIRISDFDSVKMFAPGRCAASVPDVSCVPKSDTTKVLGTPYYRAPEQFKQMRAPVQIPWSQQLSNVDGLEGPWCDMWAIGVIVTQLCLGKQRAIEREKVCRTMVTTPTTLPSSSNPTPEVEGFVARERLSTLREKCIRCQQLAPLADIAALCLEPDFKRRVTADTLLKNDFFL